MGISKLQFLMEISKKPNVTKFWIRTDFSKVSGKILRTTSRSVRRLYFRKNEDCIEYIFTSLSFAVDSIRFLYKIIAYEPELS